MRSSKEKMLMLQKELVLYSSNLEKAIDQKDQYHIIYYDVLLQITWKKLEQIYSKYVDEEEVEDLEDYEYEEDWDDEKQ